MSLPPRSWRWLNAEVLQAVHLEQLAEHGGGAGTRDQALFESALARPQNLAHYGNPDVFDLAAAYAVGLAKNHPFVDGNKRTAYVAMELFLILNGTQLTADDASATLTMLAVAAGDIDEPTLAQWLREHASPC
ncbi:type II toxin-antitoxin system death-on-curing family toxin [Roseateles puraquae]|uniref:Type II toxin-antitoxin system death-on-curing family toxin n=1 Tax=Roseateles puraquae TaxID=431059 RepID=A0A254N8M4_9BURK|nr:type II toxin-antitoxin system death-on-curing family toxin [Roseateles puraquae]MDG0854544.1 type II toxin-antitoxin system death-on-curing family toxin [Roseateles puraquae]OWR03904.1 type II toxin-antitoxin system death-on-curing family toxin [Roseateles puraquae]